MHEYNLIAFGRHSDLLNLAFNIKSEISSADYDLKVNIYSDRDVIDGMEIKNYDAKNVSYNFLTKKIIFSSKESSFHFVSPSIKGLFFAFLAFLFRKKIFSNIHRFDFKSYGFFKRIFLFFYTFLFFLISKKIFVHARINKFLVWKKKIVFVELPFHVFKIKKDDFLIEGKYILFFGRLDANKGLDLLEKIADLIPNFNFKIFGELVDSSLNPLLERMETKNNISIHVKRVDNKDIPSLFKDAIFTILPYSNGTESGIPFLSRSLYTPVLISDINELARSTKELDLGISISSQNPIQWKNKIYDTDWYDLRLNMIKSGSPVFNKGLYKETISTIFDVDNSSAS